MVIDDAEPDTAALPPVLPGVISGLCFRTERKLLLDHVDLLLDGTGITVVLGPNGAGKSLLLRLMHGLLAPSAGAVTWHGMPPTTAVRRRQALVFQRPVLLRRSVRANLAFVLGLRRAAATADVDALLDRFGLAAYASQPARSLSGGEQQRLALARALALDPEVLFLDEPAASLDPAATAAIEQLVRAAAIRGTRVVLVTHDVGQARRLASEVVFLHQGRLLEHTPADRFFDRPESDAARDFLVGRLVF